ncbi:interferon-induced protein 44-like [Ylistrum balloti]|uniref:interferon-induced protein 44-like n=1 Tax=Ylistrum balloti TaxID=509963 RepID=UPI002905B660|nr:interferon-induced protein 44-like [Ylistrum balloti]
MTSLSDQDKETFQRFIGEGFKDFEKLYSFKEDGSNADVFHKKCDNRGPTVTVIYDSLGQVYGGYTSVSWQSASIPQVFDKSAFLFCLRSDGDNEKFPVRKCESALVYDGKAGPIFGNGPDLEVFTGTVDKKDDGTFVPSSKMTADSYQHMPMSIGDVIESDVPVIDVIVYRVKDKKQNITSLQWRDEPHFDKQYLSTLIDEVESYWPLKKFGVSEEALEHVNILFIGPIGAGKSSFLNSVESVFRGHVTMSAAAGSRGKSVTSMYRQYPITASDNRRYLKFQLCDCRGLEDAFSINKDIDAILDGHVPDNYIFNVSSPVTNKTHGYRRDPKLKDKIHCVVYVLEAEKYAAEVEMSFVTEPVKEQIMEIQDKIDQRGIPQLILLNKIDNACSDTKGDTSLVYRSELIRQRCYHAANCLGLPPLTVLPMRNHFMELTTSDEVAVLTLYNVRQMLRAADSYLRVNYLTELRQDIYESSLIH